MPRTSKPPWRRRRADDDGDSTESEVIVVPSDTPSPIVGTADSPAPSVETADTPAPSVETDSTPAPSVETYSTPAPVVAAPSTGEFPCPMMLKLPIEWRDILYFRDPNNGKLMFNTKDSPIPLPHIGMEFRGYIVEDNGSVFAFFTDKSKVALQQRGTIGAKLSQN